MGYSGLLKDQHINKIQGLASGWLDFAEDVMNGRGVKFAFGNNFSKNGKKIFEPQLKDGRRVFNVDANGNKTPVRNMNWGNIDYTKLAASSSATIFGANVVGGALAGGFTDDNGNFDVQGIPLI